jgi:hypothetical protein
MEGPLNHLLHAFLFGVLLYLGMKFALGQSQTMALNRSMLLAALALIYMILFEHGMPTT